MASETRTIEKAALLDNILEALPYPFFVIDAETRTVLAASGAACDGTTVRGAKCYALLHGRDAPCGESDHPCPLDETVRTRRPVTVEHTHRNGDQEEVYEVHCAPIFDDDGRVAQVVEHCVGVSRRKILEAENRSLEERLRHAQKMEAIGQLAGGVAHDFNNQLTAILGYADMLRSIVQEKRPVKYAEMILRAARRSSDLTRQLLAFARRGRSEQEPVDVHRIVEEVVSFLAHSIDKRIDIRCHLEAAPSVVTGDATQLQNALLNLAINARDAMPGGGQLRFETRVRPAEEVRSLSEAHRMLGGAYLEIAVTDTGEGMDEETQKHIFDPFFTTKSEGETRGTGLGLAAVYDTVKRHRGLITVESRPGGGSCFVLLFPLGKDDPREEARRDAPAAEARTGRIMVVDDEEIVRSMASDMLSRLGYTVEAFADGAEALEHFRERWREVDLVILDRVMPRLNGRETFRAMKKIDPDVHALASSGYGLDAETRAMLDEGVLGFVDKPFDLDVLTRKVQEAMPKTADRPE